MARRSKAPDPRQSGLFGGEPQSTAETQSARQDPVPAQANGPALQPPELVTTLSGGLPESFRSCYSFHQGDRRSIFSCTGLLASCLACKATVTVLMMPPDRPPILSDTMPKERTKIAEVIGDERCRFRQRLPRLNQNGDWVRESHDCKADLVEKNPDPEIGWKPMMRMGGKLRDKGGNSSVYDAG
jgi:hypothetical protein